MMAEPMPVAMETDNRRARLWVNWAAALLTAAGAALVMVFAMGAVMSTAACSTAECPDLGPSGTAFGVLYYGAPAISALTILASFFTAGGGADSWFRWPVGCCCRSTCWRCTSLFSVEHPACRGATTTALAGQVL